VNVRYDVAKNWHISSNIFGSTGLIFAFREDDGSCFPICLVTLSWQPNNVSKMKAN